MGRNAFKMVKNLISTHSILTAEIVFLKNDLKFLGIFAIFKTRVQLQSTICIGPVGWNGLKVDDDYVLHKEQPSSL